MSTTTETTREQATWRTVATREVMVKLHDRAFIVGTVTSLLMLIMGIAVGAFLSTRPTTMTVVVTNAETSALIEAVEQVAQASQENYTIEITVVDSADEALQLVRDEEVDVYVDQGNDTWQLTYAKESASSFESYFTQALTAITLAELAEQAGQTTDEVAQAMSFETILLEGEATDETIAYIAGVAFAVIFMMASMIYGMQIAQSVIEEKQSRIVEILVSVIPVRHLLAGKVIGNTVMSFVQMVLMLGVALIGITLTPVKHMLPSFSSAIAWFLLFFVAGFLALACIWAAAGAMCTRSEDLQQTSMPLMWVLIAVYFAGFIATGTAQVVLSYVPIASSVLMPVRLVAGTVSWWEPVIALAINIAFSIVTVLVGERIYRRALLQTQGRLTYKQAFTLTE